VAANEFPLPALGDIVYCRFPESLGEPGPKPRPALVIGIAELDDKTKAVVAAYGTSQQTEHLRSGEFLISGLWTNAKAGDLAPQLDAAGTSRRKSLPVSAADAVSAASCAPNAPQLIPDWLNVRCR